VSALRERGARFALDDVGVGWAGLKQVSDLRPDIVKLDRSLVSGAARDPVRQAIAQMLLDLCSRLGIDLLVEGVESFEELDLFARMGVPLALGYVFGRPESVARRLIDDDLAVRLKFRAGLLRHHNKVAGHVDVSTVAFQVMDAGPDGSASAWAANGEQLPTVVVDGTGRPIALVTYDESGAARRHPAMAVTASEDVASAAQRAMTRLLPDRFAPLVCVDRSGRHVGVVSVEALVLALAGNATPDDAQRP
jgi:hypothetical protein